MSDDYDYLFKCICVGDGGCGKTALVVRFSQGYFQEQYKLTIGVEFAVKTIDLPEIGKKIKLQIWDTGGQERFQYVRPLYYRGSMGSIILFDLTNRESFDHIPKWMEEVKENAGEIPMLLVGNKKDLVDERQVSREEAEAFAEEMEMYYVESSAKDGSGVGDVFAVLSCLMIGVEVPEDYIEPVPGAAPPASQPESNMAPALDDMSSIPSPTAIDSIPKPVASSSDSSEDLFAEAMDNSSKVTADSNMLPAAFSEGEAEDDLPPFEQPEPTPAPSPEPVSVPSPAPTREPAPEEDDLFNIPAVPKKKESSLTKPMLFDEASEPEPASSPQPVMRAKLQPIKLNKPKKEATAEEWSIPDLPTPKSKASGMEAPSLEAQSIPQEDEIEATIPQVPQKKIQKAITFDSEPEPEPMTSAPKLEFTKPENIPTDDLQPFGSPKPEDELTAMPQSPQQEQPGPITFDAEPAPAPQPVKKPKVSKPITFPNAKPAEAPPGFKPKPASNPIFGGSSAPTEQSKPGAKPFSAPFTSEKPKPKEASGSMNTFLGALGSKPQSRSSGSSARSGFTPFSSSGGGKKKASVGFIPKTKSKSSSIQLSEIGSKSNSEPEMIRPASSQAVKPKSKSKKRRRRKKERNKQDIIICPTCGAIINARYKFCNKCGTKL